MVGFIGALSSSLCVLILVFITLLLSYIESLLPERSIFKLEESTFRYPINSYYVSDETGNEIKETIDDLLKNNSFKIKTMYIGCTYGFDMTEDIANNIMAYNSIKINGFKFAADFKIISKITKSETELNYCYIDLNKGDGNG
ncbi:MAG: hypothetical protein ACRC24_03565 [Vibrionaceae bacterium]